MPHDALIRQRRPSIVRRLGAAALAAALWTAATADQPAESDLYQPVDSPETLNYLLHLPQGYADSGEPFPLLLFLHGIAQKGNGSPDSIGRVADDGPFRTMRDGHWNEALPLIVIGPQSGGIQPWWRGTEVRKVLQHARVAYRIDPARVYLTGISMGGRSVWWLARNFASEFAAVVPTSTWAGDLRQACDELHHLAIWSFHGARDPLIGLTAGRRPIEVLSGCMPPLLVEPRMTVLEEAGHGRWDIVYASRHGDRNQGGDHRQYGDIYEWMLTFENPRADARDVAASGGPESSDPLAAGEPQNPVDRNSTGP